MADEAPKPLDKGHWTTDPFAVIFTLLLAGALLNGVLTNLQERFGFDPNDPTGSLSARATGELHDGTPLGTPVRVEDDLVVHEAPSGDSRVLGTQLADSRGELIDGPEFDDEGNRWWEVDFLSAPDGWVDDKRLRTPRADQLLGPRAALGSAVRTVADSDLFQDPGGAIRGVVSRGVMGTLIGGPFSLGNIRWWQVEFENGLTGWVRESVLERVAGEGFFSFFASLRFWFITISLIVSALLITGIVIIGLRLNRVRTEEMLDIWSALPQGGDSTERNYKWEHVLELVNSERPSEWRQAIIEADIILDEMVTKMGYRGDSLGEKLKSIEPSDFLTLNAAWEAHKVRNKIAHEGSDFILTQREARRVIGLYEEVFREFYYV